MPTPDPYPSPVDQIPPADQIRERLAALGRERQLLRQLLRLAQRRERDRATAPQGGSHAA